MTSVEHEVINQCPKVLFFINFNDFNFFSVFLLFYFSTLVRCIVMRKLKKVYAFLLLSLAKINLCNNRACTNQHTKMHTILLKSLERKQSYASVFSYYYFFGKVSL